MVSCSQLASTPHHPHFCPSQFLEFDLIWNGQERRNQRGTACHKRTDACFLALLLHMNETDVVIWADNKCARFLLCCLKCCFWCLEKFIKFLNRNAYIMIAIYGTNFCTSAKNAFFLLMRNIIRVAVLDKVTDFLLFLGKLLVVGCVGILAFFFFTHRIRIVQDTAPTLNYYWVPILTVIVGSYLIAHGFFSVYGMCVDTLFLCFLEDLERNDGSTERPFFMSPNLQKLLNKKNKGQTDK
ncbi:hypothetical protein AB205_0188620 [Aquarana catesbeiana]|uniref:Choline transporter-like protein n=1 Tax=Aquarana catesbeiana TaxID=8400 RepID=A0A2G9S3K2_AQUCT|nr:hypothetical protein AB205_0188620 [Aquarana catesbeiana]